MKKCTRDKKRVTLLEGALCAQAQAEKPVLAKERRVVWDKAAFEALLREGGFAKALELVRRMQKLRPDNPSFVHAVTLLENHVEGSKGEQQVGMLFEEACRAFLEGDKALAERMFLTCQYMQPDAWFVRFNLSRLRHNEHLNAI
ncbi:MAG: hypothetical protein FWC28_06075 [Proteobacteria bacterium]|nr:hypothetical protein [Cystobacterineae bacterium]MCL2258823.1 hypothetical protein [Cystobacterineae bacterium]MCL2314800.1 hypothetical protein [Pseudomonadota bacterium]